MPIDLVNRFVATPLKATLNVSGKVVCFATNSLLLVDRLGELPSARAASKTDRLHSSWRIVTEYIENGNAESVSFVASHVGDSSLSFITIDQHSFLAYDQKTRSGISFLSEELVRNPILFFHVFLPAFMTLLELEEERT